ncbi:MAG: zinc-ribbon domain-containing protein [Eggerthellaceae bacterium]|nr:zinc-ribbon domain-containing protein [Eggerthellaceae bacterium]
MFCVQCGQELEEGTAFCPQCGTQCGGIENSQAPQGSNYGNSDAVNASVQPSIANGNSKSISMHPSGTQAPAMESDRPSRKGVLAVVAIAIAALSLGGIAWAMTIGPLGSSSNVVTIGGTPDITGTTAEELFASEVGDVVTFGTYEQDGDETDGAEPLEWLVVRKDGSRMQLVACNLIDYQPYASENMGFEGVYSDLRTWLNKDFVTTAFTEDERTYLRDTIVAYPGQPLDIYNPTVDAPERDQAFLLSNQQAQDLFASNADRIAQPSAYAAGLPGAPAKNAWWLRSTGFERQGAGQVQPSGEVDTYGVSVVESQAYVRPSVWIAMPTEMVRDADEQGRFGVYADAVGYMSQESVYTLADLDSDEQPELIVLSGTRDDSDALTAYFYGYERSQAIYLGSYDMSGYSRVLPVRIDGQEGCYLLGLGSHCALVRVTASNGTCAFEAVCEGTLPDIQAYTNYGAGCQNLTWWNCDDLSGVEWILDGWSTDRTGISMSDILGEGAEGAKGTAESSELLLDQYRDKATEGMTSTIINAENIGTRHDLNLFLSNFTEKSSTFTFDWNTCTDEEMCLFAIDHTRLNFPDAIQDASSAGLKNADGQLCTERVDWETFSKYPRVFLKKDFSEGNVTNPCVYYEGYVCFPGDGWHVPNGVAYVTSTTDIGDNRVLVTFDVYGDGVDYVVTDESYYTCYADELEAKLGVSGISRTGCAIVEPCDDGTVAPFKLWAFESN